MVYEVELIPGRLLEHPHGLVDEVDAFRRLSQNILVTSPTTLAAVATAATTTTTLAPAAAVSAFRNKDTSTSAYIGTIE